MHVAATLALILAASFGVIGPLVARRVVPAAAVWLLSIGGLVSAASAVLVLALLSLTLIGQYSELAEGHWSIVLLRRHDPVRWPIAAAAVVAMCIGFIRLGLLVSRKARAVVAARRACAGLASFGDLVVTADPAVDAYALPGRPGRIVVTRGMLCQLDVAERHVVFEHERSHLRHHHHWHATAARAAVALNPLLRSIAHAQGLAVERWADEDAARGCDRGLAASTLARVAAVVDGDSASRPAAALAAVGGDVSTRVSALMSDPPKIRPVLLVLAAQVAVLSALASGYTTLDTFTLFARAGLRV